MSSYTPHQVAPKDKFGRPLYGMDVELTKKQQEKENPQRTAEVMHWIQAVTNQRFHDPNNVQESLKDGQVLCQLINVIRPGTIKKINDGKLSYLSLENLHVFSKACVTLGLPPRECFAEADLYEAKNIPWVIESLHSFATLVQNRSGGQSLPKLGVKVSPRKTPLPPKTLPQRVTPPTSSPSSSNSNSRPAPGPPKPVATSQSGNGSGSSSGGGGGSGNYDDLIKLAELRDKGILTNAEFEAKKKQILGL